MTHSTSPDVPIEALLVHREWVRALARTLVADPAAADDVEQEAWRHAIERPPRHSRSLRAWFGRVVRNVARGRARSERRRARRDAVCADARHARSPLDLVAETELHQRLVAAVLALDETSRSTVLRRWFDGMSVAEIAAHDGISADTVKTRLRRALARLREKLPGKDRDSWAAILVVPGTLRPAWSATAAAFVGGAALIVAAVVLSAPDAPDGTSTAPVSPTVVAAPSEDGGPASGERPGRARTGTPAGREPARPAHAVNGSVIRKQGGTPVAGAHVVLYDDPWAAYGIHAGVLDPGPARASTTTDEHGAFAMQIAGGTRGVLVATADGLCAAALAWSTEAPARFELLPAAPATVQVVRAEDRAPIEGARVLEMAGVRQMFPVREARTDSNGIASLPFAAANATLLVTAPGRQVTGGRPAGTIALRAAEEIAGVVIDDQDVPVPDALVVATCLPSRWSVMTRSDAAGRFRLGGFCREDSRQVTATAAGHHRASVVFAGSDEAMRVVLHRIDALGGRVLGPDGEPVAGAKIEFSPLRGDVAETVTDAGGNFAFRTHRDCGGTLRASSGEMTDAQYSLGPALVDECTVSGSREAGPLTLRLRGREVSFVRAEAVDANGHRLQLGEVRAERLYAGYEEDHQRLLVVSAQPGTTVRGRFTAYLDDLGFPPLFTSVTTGPRDAPPTLVTFPACPVLRVELRTPDGLELPARAHTELWLQVVTESGLRAVNEDPSSEFRTRIEADKDYVLDAFAVAGDTAWVAHREFRGSDVAEEPLHVRLRPAPRLRGQLVRGDGVPIKGGSVSGGRASARVGTDGSFSLPCRTQRTVDLVYYDGRSKVDLPLGRYDVPAAGEMDCGAVAVPRVIEVRGRVVHDDGTPAGGAAVRFVRGPVPDGWSFPTGADGSFTLPLADGQDGAIVATKNGHGAGWRLLDDVAHATSSADVLELRLQPEGSARVRVPFCNPECGELRGTIVRTEGGRVAWSAASDDHRLEPRAESWTFVVTGLPPGNHVIDVLGRDRDWSFDVDVVPGATIEARAR